MDSVDRVVTTGTPALTARCSVHPHHLPVSYPCSKPMQASTLDMLQTVSPRTNERSWKRTPSPVTNRAKGFQRL